MSDPSLSVKDVRRNCLECSGGSAKYVTWCPSDGVHSTGCHLWPFRFGMQPATFRRRYGDRLLTPELMPPAEVNLEELPATLEEAATAAISISRYEQPPVELVRVKAELTAAQEDRIRKMNLARKRAG